MTNIEYLVENIAKFSSIPIEKGITRESYTEEHRKAADFLKKYMESIGLIVREDEVGTIFGRLEGSDKNAKCIMSGSHLDSVREGGKYDGIAGIVTAIEALNDIKKSNKPHKHPIEAVVMTEEEGCRYLSSLFSSRAMTGMVTNEELRECKDDKGIALIDAMQAYGVSGDLEKCVRNDIEKFVELHIEQGPVLENAQKEIGIVTGIVALRAYNLRVFGKAGHAGTTPMAIRQDPLVASGEIIAKLYDMGLKMGNSQVLTVGKIEAKPGSANVIPYEVELTIDLRNPKESFVEQAEDNVKKIAQEVCDKYGVNFELECAFKKESADMDKEIMDIIEKAACDLQYSNMRLPSGAGHDSQIMAKKVPTAMIFIQNKDGRSHCKEEFATLEHLEKGKNVLAEVLLKLAE